MKILFFGPLKDLTRCAEMTVRCEDTDTGGLWRMISEAYPGIERSRRSVRLARNSEYVGPEARFKDDDEVALIPPVSGG